jgi:hypothetical protein
MQKMKIKNTNNASTSCYENLEDSPEVLNNNIFDNKKSLKVKNLNLLLNKNLKRN